jgi:hypothetical protein
MMSAADDDADLMLKLRQFWERKKKKKRKCQPRCNPIVFFKPKD